MNNKKIFISVISVVKNGMPFFAETVKSVLDQDYDNFEYIVIDGKSSDGSLKIIKDNEKSIVKWVSESDDGIADAFNKGFNISRGDYILYLNSDDALLNHKVLREFSSKIVEMGYPDIIYGDCEVVDRNSSEVLYKASIDLTISQILKGGIFPHPSTLTSRRYFFEYGLFDPKFKIAMDYEFFLRGVKKASIVHVPLMVTRVRNGGVSTVSPPQVVNEIISALRKNGNLTTPFGGCRLRYYFWIRRNLRILLTKLGLYEFFIKMCRTS
jgi:glycosyltransferase